jgi:hypothetical protein
MPSQYNDNEQNAKETTTPLPGIHSDSLLFQRLANSSSSDTIMVII